MKYGGNEGGDVMVLWVRGKFQEKERYLEESDG